MQQVHDRFGVSSVMVSHDIEDLSKIVDKMIVISQGQIIASGPTEEMMNSNNQVVRDFILEKV